MSEKSLGEISMEAWGSLYPHIAILAVHQRVAEKIIAENERRKDQQTLEHKKLRDQLVTIAKERDNWRGECERQQNIVHSQNLAIAELQKERDKWREESRSFGTCLDAAKETIKDLGKEIDRLRAELAKPGLADKGPWYVVDGDDASRCSTLARSIEEAEARAELVGDALAVVGVKRFQAKAVTTTEAKEVEL